MYNNNHDVDKIYMRVWNKMAVKKKKNTKNKIL